MRWIDAYFYRPNLWQKALSIAFLPISLLYAMLSLVRRKCARYHNFHIPIISVGNLIVGGSGKTPFIIESARHFERVCVVSRGYKRASKGLVVVSEWGKILCSQAQAGDEPYLLARELKNASVIVSKNRAQAIQKAKEMGAKIVFLDDGFRFNYAKFNILLFPLLKPYFPLCLPSGMYREIPSAYKEADLLVYEGRDYRREVNIESPTPRMLLLTAIANPARLDEFLPPVVGKITLQDHAQFDKTFLQNMIEKYNATSLLVTSKDEVKLLDSGFRLSVMRLNLKLEEHILESIKAYIHNFKA
ncbi:tetraacyldisaccharide 4'-kinase [Helicobacter marmotae]|uniref:Tetraacyldisaccharide 4'-kinase n=1 Tax=Helicobacter marmotae TaxID=152490 RepID=A0A3D8I2V2_9HELI|nr:tetraacyldisaccharide 4'-kinase [Helicobacter marmotae]RDU59306.1 tetraacyldisaccharide 4'-kinase [Helicobacter marmotae]